VSEGGREGGSVANVITNCQDQPFVIRRGMGTGNFCSSIHLFSSLSRRHYFKFTYGIFGRRVNIKPL
jgi:hypothetical protein